MSRSLDDRSTTEDEWCLEAGSSVAWRGIPNGASLLSAQTAPEANPHSSLSSGNMWRWGLQSSLTNGSPTATWGLMDTSIWMLTIHAISWTLPEVHIPTP